MKKNPKKRGPTRLHILQRAEKSVKKLRAARQVLINQLLFAHKLLNHACASLEEARKSLDLCEFCGKKGHSKESCKNASFP